MDGVPELFLLYTVESEHPWVETATAYYLHADVFVLEDGVPAYASSMLIGSYFEEPADGMDMGAYFAVLLTSNETTEDKLSASSVVADGEKYIIFEYANISNCYDDSGLRSSWGIKFAGGELEMVFILSRDGDGADVGAYSGYEYNSNGDLVSAELLVADENSIGEGLYEDLNEAISEFYGHYGIPASFIDWETSIFSDRDIHQRIFSLSFDCVEEDGENHTFAFEVNDFTNLRDVIALVDSPSARTDFQSGLYTESEILAWAFGCSAVLAEANRRSLSYNYDPYYFGMFEENEANASFIRLMLASSWSVNSREDLYKTIERMTESGHNGDFAELYGYIEDFTAEDMKSLSEYYTADEVRMIQFTKDLGDKWDDAQIRAWDWFRMVHLAGWGYIAGYVDKEEAYELMIPSIDRLRSTFSSWDEATENYLDGYAWWSQTDVSLPGTEYQNRVEVYKDLRAMTGDLNLYDDTIWD
jgi:hypothetical protein